MYIVLGWEFFHFNPFFWLVYIEWFSDAHKHFLSVCEVGELWAGGGGGTMHVCWAQSALHAYSRPDLKTLSHTVSGVKKALEQVPAARWNYYPWKIPRSKVESRTISCGQYLPFYSSMSLIAKFHVWLCWGLPSPKEIKPEEPQNSKAWMIRAK